MQVGTRRSFGDTSAFNSGSMHSDVTPTSRLGKSLVKKSRMPMMPSMSATGTWMKLGLRPASSNRYCP